MTIRTRDVAIVAVVYLVGVVSGVAYQQQKGNQQITGQQKGVETRDFTAGKVRRVRQMPTAGQKNKSIGVWRVTAYCLCDKCIDVPQWRDGLTASGVPAEGRIVAGPPTMPFGTVLDIEGYGRASVEDRGGSIKGRKLDILMESHQKALVWGVKKIEIFQVLD